MIKFGLVTVLYNGLNVLNGFFDSLAAQTISNWHLEVIDNSPDDGPIRLAQDLVKKYGLHSVNFVRNPENYGVAKGNNQGIYNCLKLKCDYIVILNNDIEFNATLLSALEAEIEANSYQILVPKIFYFDSKKIWYGGGRINQLSATVRHYGDCEDDSARYQKDYFTNYAPTCFMAIKSEVFALVGVMDEEYFVYYDDTDFVLRCLRAGVKLRFLGKLAVYHKVSSSTGGGSSPFAIYYYNRNRLIFIRKNARGATYILSICWFFATRLYKYLVYSRSNRAILAKSISAGMGPIKIGSASLSIHSLDH